MDKGGVKRLLFGRSRPLRWVVPVLVLLGLTILQWRVPNWADRAEAWTVDVRFRLRGEEDPRFPIFVVALDESSFQMLGDLHGENIRTWPRTRWAELVEQIAAGEPRVIGLDVIFDTPGWDEGGDGALADALAEAGTVVLASHFDQSEVAQRSSRTLSEPLPLLGEAAAAVGVNSLPVDADAAIRRVSLLWPWGDRTQPAFSLVTAALFSGEPVDVGRADLGTDASLPVHFRGPEGTFQTISMYRLLLEDADEAVDPGIFQDAIVLVGYTTQLEQDLHPAPFGGESGMAGVEIHANAVDTLLAGDWLHRPPTWLPILLVGIAGLGALLALNMRQPGLGVVVLLGGIVIYSAVGVGLFIGSDYLLPLVAPLVSAVAVGGTSLAERMVFAERDKRRLRRRFAGVMSPERLEAVLDEWEALLEDERPQKRAAVLFADVRGFTRATESLMRQSRSPEMVRFLSAYLDAMAEAVFAEGGVIYDVVGDGLMILFGVPEPFPDYALRAVRAAVRMARATESLQEVWPQRDRRPLGMGIGVHCGSVVDAVVGRGRRMEYAVIGDPVNTAARIEAHCKVAMEIPRPPGGEVPERVTILLSADLYEEVREHVLVDEGVPPFRARGKSEPLGVVRLLGLKEEPPYG
ncbi:MAG: adenylate/guanylate cyclase domain-containing protein [Anaerolineae bacterium]